MSQSLQSRQRLYQELQQAPDQINLARAALYIAQEEYPYLDVASYLTQLDTMAAALRRRLPTQSYPLKIIAAVNQYLFEELEFRGNQADYYNPCNSFLNDVLTRRLGIPISLSLIYLELAGRVGFPMAGVGMPGHFLLRPTLEDMAIFVDPFHRGEILFEQDCRDCCRQLFGEAIQLRPLHLQPISPQAWIVRMLANLKMIYLQQRQMDKTLAAIDRILLICPEAVSEWRDRGLIYYQQGDLKRAHGDLQRYLQNHPEATDGFEIRQVIDQIERLQTDH
ncbi:MAG: tetratricopeptide repeat protein [Nodosilinea sp. LVE1205-7]|jgi:regulator of sirC expression with transglutaminase-like and TPR domain